MNWINYLLSLVFLLFAFLQLNDPDPIRWTSIYLLAAGVSLLYGLGRLSMMVTLLWLLFLLISFALYFPDLYQWIKNGFPSITGEMKAQTNYIELVRESLGLLSCLIPAIIYFKLPKEKV